MFFFPRSFISYTMAVIAVNFVVPLCVMFYCYYSVTVTVRRYKASNCLGCIDMDWSDQMDVTKVKLSRIFRLCLLMPHASVFMKCMFKQRRLVLVKICFCFFYKYPIYVVQYYNITVDTLSEFGRLTFFFFTMVIALVQTTVFLKIGK